MYNSTTNALCSSTLKGKLAGPKPVRNVVEETLLPNALAAKEWK
jgi:hypothetical protein